MYLLGLNNFPVLFATKHLNPYAGEGQENVFCSKACERRGQSKGCKTKTRKGCQSSNCALRYGSASSVNELGCNTAQIGGLTNSGIDDGCGMGQNRSAPLLTAVTNHRYGASDVHQGMLIATDF